MRRTAILIACLGLTAQPGAADEAPASPAEGGPRAFAVKEVGGGLNMRDAPSISGRVAAKLASGDLLQNLGCREAEGRAWCDVQPIRGGPRGFVAADFLAPAIGPDGAAPLGEDDSAFRAGQMNFDATGSVPCAEGAGQPMSSCEMGVARSAGGYATLSVKLPDGRERFFFFALGIAVGAGTVEADPTGAFSATREGDLTLIRLGDERYEIPDAAVLGG